MQHVGKLVAGSLAAALMIGPVAGASAASAAPKPALPGNPVEKARGEAAINERLADLNVAIDLVNHTPWLGTDQAALLSILNGDISGDSTATGLTALETTIENQTDPQQLRSEVNSIYSTYRVYALVLPQTHLVRAADLITTDTLSTLRATDAELKTAIAAETAAGKNVSGATAADDSLETEIAAISTDTAGLSSQLLALTPAQWDANHSVLDGPRSQLVSATSAVSTARADITTALGDLQ